MLAFDHDNPETPDQWKFAFVEELAKLRPDSGGRLAATMANLAYQKHSDMKPKAAARQWIKDNPLG